MKLWKLRLFLVTLLLVVLAGGIGYQQGKEVGRRERGGALCLGGESERVDLGLFWDVWSRLERSYLDTEALDDKKMVYGAIKGLTAAVDDPYTAFLPPNDNTRNKQDLSGEFDGVGIQLGYIDKTLAVMSPLQDNPAIKQGIRAGDLILRIKDKKKKVDKDTVGMSLYEAMDLIRGKKGNPVALTILHEGKQEAEEITIVRDTIKVPSVEIVWKDDGRVAWLKVLRFGSKTAVEWKSAVDEIEMRKEKKDFEGIVLDLRNNPGGYLKGAVDLASEFVPSGVVVQQEGRDKTDKFEVNRKGRLLKVPMVILVNRGSASASEILAGTLRERLGIKVVGGKTFGKGTVQEAQELTDGAGLHVTIARWLLPSGENIHNQGLVPDVEVEYEVNEEDSDYDSQLEKAIEVLKGG